MSKNLLFCIALLLFASFCNGSGNVCTTQQCQKRATDIKNALNAQVNPCNDFYQFACGSLLESKSITAGEDQWNNRYELKNSQKQRIAEFLSNDDFPSEFQQIKDIYDACINTENIENAGLSPLIKKLGQIRFDQGWEKVFEDIASYWGNVDILHTLFVWVDPVNKNKNIINVHGPNFGLSHEQLKNGFDDAQVQKYYNYMINAKKLVEKTKRNSVLSDDEVNEIKENMKQALLFEIKLATKSKTRNEIFSTLTQTVNKIVLAKDMASLSGQSNGWTGHFKKIFSNVATIDENQPINVMDPAYFDSLPAIFNEFDESVIKNYLEWRFIQNALPYLNEEARKVKEDFDDEYSGIQGEEDRQTFCLTEAGFFEHDDFKPVLLAGSLYAIYFKNDNAVSEIKSLFPNIVNAYKDIFDNNNWLDDATKQESKKTFDDFFITYGYAPEHLNKKKVSGLFTDLKTNGQDYFENSLNTHRFFRTWFWKLLEKPTRADPTSWKNIYTNSQIDIFYYSSGNLFTIPIIMLQPPFFYADDYDYLNYGSFGSRLATAAATSFSSFSNQLSITDKSGTWPQSSVNKLEDKKKCFARKFSKYVVNEKNIDGSKTFEFQSNAVSGMKAAYKAFDSILKTNGNEPKLSGLESYTDKQMFWISYAQSQCTKYTAQALDNVVSSAKTVPASVLVNGIVSNFEEFKNDFNCPANSVLSMNEKCPLF